MINNLVISDVMKFAIINRIKSFTIIRKKQRQSGVIRVGLFVRYLLLEYSIPKLINTVVPFRLSASLQIKILNK